MNRILTNIIGLFFIAFCLTTESFVDKKLIMGTIQFPKSLQTIPSYIQVYCGGKKMRCEVDKDGKRIIFYISVNKYQTDFYLLVANHINFPSEENTIKYLKLNPGDSYKLYALRLIPSDSQSASWTIQEIKLPTQTLRIPDDTIRIYYNADYVQSISGGSALEFPAIQIRDDIVTLVGSEEQLIEESDKQLIASLNHAMLHENTKWDIKPDPALKTIIALER